MAQAKPWVGRTLSTAVCVLAVAIGGSIISHHSAGPANAAGEGPSASASGATEGDGWSTKIDDQTISDLKEQGYAVEPADAPDGAAAADAVVENALGSFNGTSKDQIRSISYAMVTNLNQGDKAETRPNWVIYLTNVPEVYVGAPASESDSASDEASSQSPILADMAIFVDPKTMEMRWAVQY